MVAKSRPEERGFPRVQLVRAYPSVAGLNGQREGLEEIMREYIKFLGRALVPSMVVDEVVKLAQSRGYVSEDEALSRINRRKKAPEESRTPPFYVLGPDDKSFALVRPGNPTARQRSALSDPLQGGLRLLASHVDAPCLIAKQRPLFFEWSPDEKELQPGVMIDTYQYGGTKPYQWGDLPVALIGTGVINGRRYEKHLLGTVIGHSAHLDKRDDNTTMGEGFNWDAIKVFTGHPSRKALLEELGLSSEDDFFTTSWYAVPKISPTRLGDFIAAYGHDDRSCTFVAVQALLRAKRTPHTSMVIGFDFEEIYSSGSGAAGSNFIERVIDSVRRVTRSKLSTKDVLTQSIGISADVDIAPGPHELVTSGNVDYRNVARVGYGVSVYNATGLTGGYNVSLDFKDYIRRILRTNGIPHQLLGSGNPAGSARGADTTGTFLFEKGVICIDAGLPIAGSHGITELLHGGDLLRTGQLYQAFLEALRPYHPIRKRR